MAINSESKRRRAYVAGFKLPWMNFAPLPLPDGAVGDVDRAHVHGAYYAGSSSSAGDTITGDSYMTISINSNSYMVSSITGDSYLTE